MICKMADESIEKDVENENEGCSDDSEKSENQKCEERVSDGNSNNGKDVLDDLNKTNKIMSSIGIRKIDELNKSDENGTDKHVSCVVPKKPDGNGENGNAESGEAVTTQLLIALKKWKVQRLQVLLLKQLHLMMTIYWILLTLMTLLCMRMRTVPFH